MHSLLEKLRRPEYTGDNRCWPCTITNTALLAGVTGLLWLRGKRRTATALAVGGLAAIGLRGYLVPYTPSLAPELTAKLPVDPFDHGESATATGSLADVGEAVEPGIVLDSEAGSPTHMRRAYAIPELAATRALTGRVDDDVARAAGDRSGRCSRRAPSVTRS